MRKFLAILMLLCPLSYAQDIALIASGTTGTGQSVTINASGADLLLACSGDSGISDDAGNAWQRIAESDVPGYLNTYLYAAFNPKTSAALTVHSQYNVNVLVTAWSGVAGYDHTATAQNLPSVSIGTGKPGELAYSCAGAQKPGGDPVKVQGMTQLNTAESPLAAPTILNADAYTIPPTASAANVAWTLPPNNSSSIFISTFYSDNAPGPMAIQTTSMPEAVVGGSFSQQLAASGGRQPYTWTVSSGTLPAGLALSPAGLIFGAPSAQVVNSPVVFTATDSQGTQQPSGPIAFSVAASQLALAASPCPHGKQLTAYAGCAVTASGGIPPYIYGFSTDSSYQSLPEGLKVDPSTGKITGSKIMGQGGYNAFLTVTDAAGATSGTAILFAIDGDNTFGGQQLFPADSWVHQRVDSLPADTSVFGKIYSAYQNNALRPLFGAEPGTGGIPINTYPADQPMVAVNSNGGGNQFVNSLGPIPCDASMEGTLNNARPQDGSTDSHVLGVRLGAGSVPPSLWEMYQVYPNKDCTWSGYGTAQFSPPPGNPPSLLTYDMPHEGATVDMAGLPMASELVNYDEVAGGCAVGHECGEVKHAMRLTLAHTLAGMVWPGTASAGFGGGSCYTADGSQIGHGALFSQNPTSQNYPAYCLDANGNKVTAPGSSLNPAGEVFRLAASTPEPAACAGNPVTHILFTAWEHYGLILADNGLTGFVPGTPDARWPPQSTLSACFSQVKLGSFEGVNMQSVAKNWPNSMQTTSTITVTPPSSTTSTTGTTTSVTITATDSGIPPQVITQPTPLTVVPAPAPPLNITTTTLPNAQVGVAYNACVSYTGGTGAVAITFAGLPAGLVPQGNCITGMPTAAVQ